MAGRWQVRAVTFIGILSARCSLQISAQFSTVSTPSTPGSAGARVSGRRSNSDATPGQYSHAANTAVRVRAGRTLGMQIRPDLDAPGFAVNIRSGCL